MTSNKVIILNTLTTYTRSLIVLVLGLFSARWVLRALGETNLGLWKLVGSFIAVVTLLNGVLGLSVARHYAFAIGQTATMPPEIGKSHICKWFNTAMGIHIFLPTLLVAIGLPLGYYAIVHWFDIPPDRLTPCLVAFNISMLNAFFSMLSVPYSALFRAHQYISELSFIQLSASVLNFISVYALLWVPYDKLIFYAAAITGGNLLMVSILYIRARQRFPYCKLKFSLLFDKSRTSKMFSFASWELLSSLGAVCVQDGATFLVNKKLGPKLNAPYSIATQVSAHTSSFAEALLGALAPTISTAEGNNARDETIRLACACDKFVTLLIMLFALPLIVEMEEILRLWLEKPPPHTCELCTCILSALILHKLAIGQHLAIQAKGVIKYYHIALGTTFVSAFFFIFLLFNKGVGIISIGIVTIALNTLVSAERAIFGQYLIGISVWTWFKQIVIPIATATALSFGTGYFITTLLPMSLPRALLSVTATVATTAASAWVIVLNRSEKIFLKKAAKRLLMRFSSK